MKIIAETRHTYMPKKKVDYTCVLSVLSYDIEMTTSTAESLRVTQRTVERRLSKLER